MKAKENGITSNDKTRVASKNLTARSRLSGRGNPYLRRATVEPSAVVYLSES